MAETSESLMTAAVMAKELGVSDTKVKKAIAALGLQPDARKGCCAYYSAETLRKVKASLK